MPEPLALDGDNVLSLVPSVVSTTIPGETVVLDPRANHYFSLEGVAQRVWELLQSPTTASAIVGTIVEEYEVEEATCERDVRAFLADLRARELLVVTTAER